MKKFLLFICSSKFLFLLSSILLVTIIVLGEHLDARYAEYSEAHSVIYKEPVVFDVKDDDSDKVELPVNFSSFENVKKTELPASYASSESVAKTERPKPLRTNTNAERDKFTRIVMSSSKSSISSFPGLVSGVIYLTFIISGLISLISFFKKRFFSAKKKATTSDNQ